MAFSGQNWKGADFYPKDSPSTDWHEFCLYASKLNHGLRCDLRPDITNGLHHLVRLLEFENKTRWVVRIQMARPTKKSATKLQNEIDSMRLLGDRTNVPVPRLFGYKVNGNNPIGVAFMLMEFFPGNSFYNSVAQIQVQMTSLRFSKIGRIVRGNDGTDDIGPFPDIGGPLETATAFFKAWATYAKFPMPMDMVRKSMNGGPVEEVLKSIEDFPFAVCAMADRLSSTDRGPFPVTHRDFFHSNIVIDKRYNIIGIIDWEGACTLPWELVDFPLFLETVPVPMDAPWNYDENGQPLDESTILRWQERREYARMVARVETAQQTDAKLSETLTDQNV
ncbi:kinase-like domain-containing protein [Phialemonium atrogriseum]|uniref:Kinase-like domain-containing protein n=1 Tax=Phialemonium atrogriseum TaxID=1093897 RepID=A0AAJ0C218_9PEZI|nr:kinase-like domain-containing protein [Phialemonium atrogriseum]KAK1768699.1 kinase-like domain-containing protein [Phialemonium atrogriseum]